MKRPNTLLSSCITALLCFSVGFVVSAGLARHKLDNADQKAEIGDKAMGVVVNMKRHAFDLYREIRGLKGELKTAKGQVTVVRAPARVITKYVRLASLPPARSADAAPQIGKLTSVSELAPATPTSDFRREFDADRKFGQKQDQNKGQNDDQNQGQNGNDGSF